MSTSAPERTLVVVNSFQNAHDSYCTSAVRNKIRESKDNSQQFVTGMKRLRSTNRKSENSRVSDCQALLCSNYHRQTSTVKHQNQPSKNALVHNLMKLTKKHWTKIKQSRLYFEWSVYLSLSSRQRLITLLSWATCIAELPEKLEYLGFV